MRTLIALALLLACFAAHGIDPREFNSPELEARYYQLVDETRCLVCQNQNLAGSNAPLAKDLRDEIAKMLQDGMTDDDIRGFLTARYGDFVLYKPPLKPSTIALWFGPVIVVLLAGLALGLSLKRRMSQTPESLGGAETEAIERRLRQLQEEQL